MIAFRLHCNFKFQVQLDISRVTAHNGRETRIPEYCTVPAWIKLGGCSGDPRRLVEHEKYVPDRLFDDEEACRGLGSWGSCQWLVGLNGDPLIMQPSRPAGFNNTSGFDSATPPVQYRYGLGRKPSYLRSEF